MQFVQYRQTFFLPAKFNDELIVSSCVIKKGKASITIEQEVIKKYQDIIKKDDVLCKGIVKVATLDGVNFKPKAMPEILYNQI